jgi:hypothetical protein
MMHDPNMGSLISCGNTTLRYMVAMMRRITILRRNLREEREIEQIKRLAEDVSMPGDEIELADAVGEPDPDCEDEIVLILASPQACNDPALEADLATTQRGGRRAICVWPEDAASDAKPSDAMSKYAYSIIRFGSERFHAIVKQEDEHCFEAPDGQPLPKPDTERNLCVDEEKAKT